MKCTKIKLNSRKDHSLKGNSRNISSKSDQSSIWITNGYHGYSYKLSRTHKTSKPKETVESNLSVTTIIFPENISHNTGASLDRWSRKTPRLTSAKIKNHTPRKNVLDDEYDFSYDFSEILEDQKLENNLKVPSDQSNEDLNLNFDNYEISSEIEELITKSQRNDDKPYEKKKRGEKHIDQRNEETLKKKRNKLKKIRFSFSRPASPVTEQVIRVDVSSNISPEELLQIENSMIENGLPRIEYCRVHEKNSEDKMEQYGSDTNNEMHTKTNIENKGMEEECIIRCRQLVLNQKKR